MKTTVLLSIMLSLCLSLVNAENKTKVKRKNYQTIGDFLDKKESDVDTGKGSEESDSDEEDNESEKVYFDDYPEDALYEAYGYFKKRFEIDFPDPDEDEMRFVLFKANLKKILDHNSANTNYKMGINQFIVYTDREFHTQILDPKPLEKNKDKQEEDSDEFSTSSERLLGEDNEKEKIKKILAKFPSVLDWSKKGKVTPVKHQMNCQGCYVFSAMAALESAILIKYNKQLILSEQEIVDCSYGFKNNGCVGGQPQFVYDYIQYNGINLDVNYSYLGIEDRCKAPTRQLVYKKLKKYVKPKENVISIIKYLQYGPVVVNHYVPDDFKYYSSGIFETNDCHHQIIINHSAIIVGYNFKHDPPYFKLKNSWGIKWGDAGYYKVKIGDLNYVNPGFCHLASNGYNVFPII